jgi:lysophospholipase L1-like esterase
MNHHLRVWGLAIAAVALVGLGSHLWLGHHSKTCAGPDQFASEIAELEAADGDRPPPERPIVFVGSSSIRLWENLQNDMAPLPVLNRGFGGSELSDVIYYVDRVVIRYRPRAVVLYAGDNDLEGNTGKSPDDVVRDFTTFVSRVQAAVPDARIYYVSIKPSRARWAVWPNQRKANEQIAAICAGNPLLGYIDIAKPMLTTGKPPSRGLFRRDGLHLTAKGYALWTTIIKGRLQKDLGEAR